MQRRRLAHPLPPDFFQCPVLTSSEADAMIASGVNALKHLVMHARLDDTSAYKWKLEHATQDLQVYVGSDLTKAKGTVVFMSVTELHATLDEAASLLETRTPTYPRNYIGLKWFVQETPLPCRNRDFCVVEVRLM
ncbi:hypothetical protein DYB34_010390 [Aphanomyces astaci]|uniref:START domain-containing protein n=1 Tax=Aphanomyces astaci TaxID=112090 RepID=A0A3R6VQ16_APHAT|nr:hypothetical protein DYB34_010390 [Aphanomyces astaci]